MNLHLFCLPNSDVGFLVFMESFFSLWPNRSENGTAMRRLLAAVALACMLSAARAQVRNPLSSLFSTQLWSSWSPPSPCALNPCGPSVSQLAPDQISCFRPRNRTHVRVERLDGQTVDSLIKRRRSRICQKRTGIRDLFDSLMGKCRNLNEVQHICVPCSETKEVFAGVGVGTRVPLCPKEVHASWLYKLLGGILGGFFLVGCLVCLSRVLANALDVSRRPVLCPANSVCCGCCASEEEAAENSSFDHIPADWLAAPGDDALNRAVSRTRAARNGMPRYPPAYKDVIEAGPGIYRMVDLSKLPGGDENVHLPSYDEAMHRPHLLVDSSPSTPLREAVTSRQANAEEAERQQSRNVTEVAASQTTVSQQEEIV